MALSFSDFIHTQLFAKIPQPAGSFTGKTVVITGANSGLGKEASQKIVALGANKVILGCRNVPKGQHAKQSIESLTHCSPDILEVWEIDLASNASVKDFATRVSKLQRLDVLLCNAGIHSSQFKVAEGTEITMTVNFINTILLSLLLIPKLKETASTLEIIPNLTFVTSALYSVAKFPEHQDDIFDWLGQKGNPNLMNQYNLSKLFQIFVIRKLSSLVDPLDKSPSKNPLVINSLDPCFCKTGLARDVPLKLRAFGKVFTFLFARTQEEGSRLLVIAALAGRESHGGYMRLGALKEYAPMIYSEEGVKNAEYVWEQLEKRLETIQPGVLAGVTG